MRLLSETRILQRAARVLLISCALLSVAMLLRSCDDDGGYGWRVYAQAKVARYAQSGIYALPDRAATPGVVDPRAVADLSGARHISGGVERNICAADFRSTAIRKTIRNFAGLKRKACAEYGLAKCDGSVEGDHLISLEIGGCPDCLANLWPQPMDEARVKDHQVEDVLPKLICAGKISLRGAQECIARDWVACGERLKGLESK